MVLLEQLVPLVRKAHKALLARRDQPGAMALKV